MHQKLVGLSITFAVSVMLSVAAPAADKPRFPAGGGGKAPTADPPTKSGGASQPAPAPADEAADGKRRLANGQI